VGRKKEKSIGEKNGRMSVDEKKSDNNDYTTNEIK